MPYEAEGTTRRRSCSTGRTTQQCRQSQIGGSACAACPKSMTGESLSSIAAPQWGQRGLLACLALFLGESTPSFLSFVSLPLRARRTTRALSRGLRACGDWELHGVIASVVVSSVSVTA